MSNHQSSRRATPRVKLPLWAVAVLGGLAVILLLIVVWITGSWLFNTVREAVASWNVTDDPFVLPDGEGGQTSGSLGSPLVSSDCRRPEARRSRYRHRYSSPGRAQSA